MKIRVGGKDSFGSCHFGLHNKELEIVCAKAIALCKVTWRAETNSLLSCCIRLSRDQRQKRTHQIHLLMSSAFSGQCFGCHYPVTSFSFRQHCQSTSGFSNILFWLVSHFYFFISHWWRRSLMRGRIQWTMQPTVRFENGKHEMVEADDTAASTTHILGGSLT